MNKIVTMPNIGVKEFEPVMNQKVEPMHMILDKNTNDLMATRNKLNALRAILIDTGDLNAKREPQTAPLDDELCVTDQIRRQAFILEEIGYCLNEILEAI